MPAKRFIFDGEFRRTSNLQFQFSRPVPTVDPEGNAVAPNTPRFARHNTIASAPLFQRIRQTSAPMTMIASGFDHDGVTPLLVTYEASAASFLDVFAGAGDALLAAEATGNGRVRTVLDATADVMRGSIPNRRYRITSGTVCHGLIVLFCTVSSFTGQSWVDNANAYVVSQDRGRTWSLAYESPPFAPGWMRGAPWAMQNWWPTTRNEAPKEAYFAATDYCANPGAPGGNFYLMRARRASPGHAWTLEPGTVAMNVTGITGEHFHTGGVVRYGEKGIRAFVAIGDNRPRNRIVSLVNRTGNYLSGDWEILPEYHGAAGNPGIDGNQFVGCAPGPWESTALVGSDLSVEQVMLLSMPEEAPHPHTTRLIGFPTSDNIANNTFAIRTPSPELGGPYCATTEPFNAITIPLSRRTLYSPDGITWAQAAAPLSGYPTLHGPHIYFDGAAGHGIVRTDVPNLVSARPLALGPGGIQHSRNDPAIDASSPRLTPLTRDALGRWVDDGVPLDPQPPSLGPVYRVRTTSNDESPWIARVYPAGLSNQINAILGDHVQVRVWVCHYEESRSGTFQIGIGNSVQAPEYYRSVLVPSTHTWYPLSSAQSLFQQPGSTLQLYVRAGGDRCADQTMYLALDTVSEGRGVPGYPMPPDMSVPNVGSARPDELSRITGFACQKSWTVTLAMQIAEDGFDFRAQLQTEWPLATLWGDNLNYIEFFANVRTNRIGARLTVNGRVTRTTFFDTSTLVRGSPFLISVAQPAGSAGMEFSVSAGGRSITTSVIPPYSAAMPRMGSSPREIRFYSMSQYPSSSGRGALVSPINVWGGQIDELRALPKSERENLLRTLSFLKPVP